jgi:hypothetical protein
LAAAWYAYQTIADQTQFMAEQRQNLELERAELHAAAEDRRLAQARAVGIEDELSVGSGNEGSYRSVVVSNYSNAPIHNVEIRFGSAYVASEVFELVHRDGRKLRGERWMTPLHLLGSDRSALFRSQNWPETTAYNNRPMLHFTDDDGARLGSWKRCRPTKRRGLPGRPCVCAARMRPWISQCRSIRVRRP